jgi:hypothetical protein
MAVAGTAVGFPGCGLEEDEVEPEELELELEEGE